MRNDAVAPFIAINISNLDEANLANGKKCTKESLGNKCARHQILAGPKATNTVIMSKCDKSKS